MQLHQANRQKAKIKMALQGPSGSGKTMSALLIAYGLTQSWNKIAIIDTESCSANLYSQLGGYQVLQLTAPFTPEKYIQAINVCINAGIKAIIIDSLSHEWEGIGGILDIHAGMTGNSFTNWSKITPRHNAMLQHILQAEVHVIATLRTKQDYILVEKNGRLVPEKTGLKSIQRDGTDYEFTLVFDLDIKHLAVASKDRTGLFMDKPAFVPTVITGKTILSWCNHTTSGIHHLLQKISNCTSVKDLIQLYNRIPEHHQEALLSEFTKKRQALITSNSIPADLAMVNGVL